MQPLIHLTDGSTSQKSAVVDSGLGNKGKSRDLLKRTQAIKSQHALTGGSGGIPPTGNFSLLRLSLVMHYLNCCMLKEIHTLVSIIGNSKSDMRWADKLTYITTA